MTTSVILWENGSVLLLGNTLEMHLETLLESEWDIPWEKYREHQLETLLEKSWVYETRIELVHFRWELQWD